MKCIYITRNILVPALMLALSVLSAPVLQTDSAKSPEPPVKQNDDETAKELQQLSKTEHIVIPAAPVVAQHTESESPQEDTSLYTDDVQDFNSEDQELPVSPNEFPLKRRYPVPSLSNNNGDFSSETRRFPSFSTDQEDASMFPLEPSVDLSPRAVAEYLLVTTDFDGFEQAMGDLMNVGVLTPGEVVQYKDSVSWEYEGLLRQMAQAESQYLQDLSRVSPMDYFNTIQQPVRSYPKYPFNQNSLEYPDTDAALNYRDQIPSLLDAQGYPQQVSAQEPTGYRTDGVQQMLMDKQKTLDDVLNLVLNEYYGKQQQPQQQYQQQQEQPQQQLFEQQQQTQQLDDVKPQGEFEEGPEYEMNPADDSPMYETSAEGDDMNQFMAYLQRTLTHEVVGAGIIEIPDKSDEEQTDSSDKVEKTDNTSNETDETSDKTAESSDNTATADFIKQLSELSSAENADVDNVEEEEQSGEIDSDVKPEIESASS